MTHEARLPVESTAELGVAPTLRDETPPETIGPPFHSGNLWRCLDCKRIRTCPWDHRADLMAWLIGFTACSCGDACIVDSEVGPSNPFLALAIARHLWP